MDNLTKGEKMQLLTKERKLMGLTVDDLKKKLDVSNGTINHWLKGNQPSAKNVFKLKNLGFSDNAALYPGKQGD